MPFDPDKYLAEKAPATAFDPDKYLAEKSQNGSISRASLAENMKRMNAEAMQRPEALNAFGASALRNYTLGAGGALLNKIDKPYYDRIANEHPTLDAAGGVAGMLAPSSAFNGAMNLVSKPVRAAANYLYKGAEALPVGLQTAAKALTYGAEVPLTAISQQGGIEAAKAVTGQNASAKRALEAGVDPTTLIAGYGLGGAGKILSEARVPQKIYSQFGPLQTKDIKREALAGRDLVQEAMDQGYHGGLGSIKNKSRANMERFNNEREAIVNQAESAAGPANAIPREKMTFPVRQKKMDMLSQAADDADINAATGLSKKYEQVLPENLGPRDTQDFLRGQKDYLRERKTDAQLGGIYSGAAAPTSTGLRRNTISEGLKTQQNQIGDVLGPQAGERFRQAGADYGLARTVNRGATQDLASNSLGGAMKGAGAAIMTPAAVYTDRLLKSTPLQNYLTMLRNSPARDGSGPQISDAEMEQAIRSLR